MIITTPSGIVSQGPVGSAGPFGPVASGIFVSIAKMAWLTGQGRVLLDDICCDSYINTFAIDPSSALHYNTGKYIERGNTASGTLFNLSQFNNDTFYRENITSGLAAPSYTINFSNISAFTHTSQFINKLTQISGTGNPPRCVNSMLAYSSNDNSLYLFGGILNGQLSSDLWKYTFSTNMWNKITPSGIVPPARQEHVMSYNSVSGTLIVFGGAVASGYVNDLWSYSISNNTWTQYDVSVGVPGVRAEHASAYDPVNNVFHVWGGRNGPTFYSEYFQFRFFGNYWVPATAFATGPGTRSGHRIVYDSQTNSLILYGGNTTVTSTAEVWQYYIEYNQWILRHSSWPPSFAGHTSVMDSVGRYMLSAGGQSSMHISNYLYNWFSSYHIDKNIWQTWSTPLLHATNGCSAWNNNNNSMYIFGGLDNSGNESSSLYQWVFNSYTSTTGINAIYTLDGGHLLTNNWSHLTGIKINQSGTSPTSQIYYAVSFDLRNTWKIYTIDQGWYSVVTLSGSQWKYRTSGGWTNSFPNTQIAALKLAFTISYNQWSRTVENQRSEFNRSCVPQLWTSDVYTVPNYVASASSEYSVNYSAWYAFNGYSVGVGNYYYWSNNTTPMANAWIQIDLGTRPFCPIYWRFQGAFTPTQNPKRFILTASNNLTNWTNIHTAYSGSDYINVTVDGWSNWLPTTATGIYRYLRMINYSTQSDVNYVGIRCIQFKCPPDINNLTQSQWESNGGFIPGTTSGIDLAVGFNSNSSNLIFSGFSATYMMNDQNMLSLRSNNWSSVKTNPIKAQCLISCKLFDGISLNTDLKVWVSSDGGTTYDQITNLSFLPNTDNYSYIYGYNNSLTKRNNSLMKLKVDILNYKNVFIYGTALGVDY